MQSDDEGLSKVPAVTLGFWIIKILATTLGETGGDAVTMSWLHADAIKGFLKPLWSREDPSYERPIRWKPKDEGVRW